ncbi:MAG TPA: hypothetical protein VFB79_23335 [Candidatus Angelobacter sp.]|nr:hypothetical protein [Candidatus Angelobacter sp.]
MVDCKKKLQELIEADQALESRRREFMQSCTEEVVQLIQETLKSQPGRASAFRFALALPAEQREKLFPDLLQLTCESSYVPTIVHAREVILTLPRLQVVDQMEASADSALKTKEEWAWRRFLELAAFLDRDLTVRLAKRAMQHSDSTIRDVGAEFLANPNPPSIRPT